MLTQSVRWRLGPVLEREVERGLSGRAEFEVLERDLWTVLEQRGAGEGESDEQVALALGIALALAHRERPCP